MSNEEQNNLDVDNQLKTKPIHDENEILYIEKKVLKYFKDRVGDKYKEELEKDNERKRNIQEL